MQTLVLNARIENLGSKENRKASSLRLKVVQEFNPLFLSLDEKELLDRVEKARWNWAVDEGEKCVERL